MPIRGKNIKILRKIYFAEAVLKETEIVPIDIKEFAQNILGAIQILKVEREENLSFKINIEGKYMLDKKCFEILLILLAQNSKYVSVYEHKTKLVIKADVNPDSKLEKIFKKIKTDRFYENKSGYLFAVFSAVTTLKKSINITGEKEILANPFSPVNIFLKGD